MDNNLVYTTSSNGLAGTVVHFGVTSASIRSGRVVIYVDEFLHCFDNEEAETTFVDSYDWGISATMGEVSDATLNVVRALARFVKNPYHYATGIRIGPSQTGNGSKIVFYSQRGYGQLDDICAAIADAIYPGKLAKVNITWLPEDAPSDQERRARAEYDLED